MSLLSLDQARTLGPLALTIGNFDGTHLGHQALFRRTCQLAASTHSIPVALTFHPHPLEILAPDRAPTLLTTLEQRAQLIQSHGIQHVVVFPFTHDTSHMSAQDFLDNILVRTLNARAVVVGRNFRFGHQQQGDYTVLERSQAFLLDTPDLVSCRGHIVSSSAIRRAISQARLDIAQRLLARPYSLTGPIVPGHGIGRTQTVPTLNLAPPGTLLPPHGVYVTRTLDPDSGRLWNSITNIGVRPTFDGSNVTIETFLLDPFSLPTPERIQLDLLHHIRPEQKFDSPELLRAQILRDVRKAHRFFQLHALTQRNPRLKPIYFS